MGASVDAPAAVATGIGAVLFATPKQSARLSLSVYDPSRFLPGTDDLFLRAPPQLPMP